MPHRTVVSDESAPRSLRIEGNLPAPPRFAVLRTKVRVGLGVAAVAYVVLAVVVVVLSRSEGERLERLRDHGVVADAIVDRKWQSGGKSKSKYVSYSFTHDGQQHIDEATVSSGRWNEIVPGRAIRITFDPADPSDTEVGAVTQRSIDAHWKQILIGSGAAGTFLLVLFVVAWFHHHRRKVLLMEGDLTSARIESIGPPRGKGRVCKVVFVVTGASGAGESHRHSVPQSLLTGLGVGESVAFLVKRHDPKRGAPLAVCLQSCRLE